jgi:uncharacterized membrane protein YoaK (UPF0700 family)
MASTRRRRRTKHRGNAAGVVEVRGRTGRRPAETERKAAPASRRNRFDDPPTWRGAFNRALVATLIFGAVIAIAWRDQVGALLVLVPFMLLIYVPLGYYTDLWMYRRRQKMKARGS